jgi:ankyrin repeat protein
MVECLLVHGADVNAKDEQGHTSLQLALKHGYEAIAEILHRHGADA